MYEATTHVVHVHVDGLISGMWNVVHVDLWSVEWESDLLQFLVLHFEWQ